MLRRFLRDSSIYAVAGATAQGIAFLLFPFFAHVLHPRQYGALDILALVGIIVNLTVALEISQGLGRYLQEARDDAERRIFASSALLFTTVCFSVFTLLVVVFAGPLSRAILGSGFGAGLFRLAAAAWFVSGILYIMADQLRWRLRPAAFGTVTVVVAATTAAVSAVLVLGVRLGVSGAIIGQLAGACAGTLLTVALSRGVYVPRFEWSRCREMLRYSVPLVPGSVGVFLNGYADRLAVQHEASLAQVGIYGIGYRFAVIISLVLLGFQGSIMPLVLAGHRDPQMRTDLARIFRIFCLLALSTFMALSLLAAPAVRLLAARAYFPAVGIVPYVVAGTLFGGMALFAPGPFIARQTRVTAVIWVLAGALNAGLAVALVPVLGITGAGIATLLSSAVSFCGLMAVSQRHYHVPHSWARIGVATGLSASVVTLSRAALPSSFQAAFSMGSLALHVGLLIVGVGALAWLLLERPERDRGWQILLRAFRSCHTVKLATRSAPAVDGAVDAARPTTALPPALGAKRPPRS